MKVTIKGTADCPVVVLLPESVEEELLLKFFDKNRADGNSWGLVCADTRGNTTAVIPEDHK